MDKNVVIERVAFIEKCQNCETHAHIQYPNGNTSGEFFSRADGHRLVAEACQCGLIAKDNVGELHRVIDELQFLENIPITKVDTILKKVVEHSEEMGQILINKMDDILDLLTGNAQPLPGETPIREETEEGGNPKSN